MTGYFHAVGFRYLFVLTYLSSSLFWKDAEIFKCWTNLGILKVPPQMVCFWLAVYDERCCARDILVSVGWQLLGVCIREIGAGLQKQS